MLDGFAKLSVSYGVGKYGQRLLTEIYQWYKNDFMDEMLDLVKIVMCTLVSRVHMTFYMLIKGYTVPGFQGTHDKLN